jgi:hypothetical protein
MSENKTKTATFNNFVVQLMIDKLEIDEMAASASISLNPNVAWMKLCLADDGKNANNQRVPREEFANVLRTGLFMPIKMAYGEISEGHDNTFPLGVMTHLKTEGNSIQALAALWDKERHEDVEFLRKRYSEGKSIDISWELTYTDEDVEDGGVTALKNVSMNAATIVGMPAYQGRTPALALSSAEEGDSMDTIEKSEHERLLTEQKEQFETQIAELQTNLSTVQAELDALKPQYDELSAYKQTIEEAKAKEEKLTSIKQKFEDAHLEITEEYFSERAESFAGMTDEQLEFFIQELVAAFKPTEDGKASISITSKDVPPIRTPEAETITPKDMVTYLRKKN